MPRGLQKKFIQMARQAGAKNIFAYAWALQKRLKGTTPKRKVVEVAKVGKKRRRRSPMRKWRRRPKTVPFEVLGAMISIPFTPAAGGYASMFDCMKAGDMQGIIDSIKTGFIGFEPGRETATPNILGLINPFDFEHGRYTKMLLWAGIAGMIRKRLVGRYTTPLFRKIPLIGRWIS